MIGFDSQVNAQVLGQVGGVSECLGAVGTLMGFGLGVRLGVNLHLGLGHEGERTHFASLWTKEKTQFRGMTKSGCSLTCKRFSDSALTCRFFPL